MNKLMLKPARAVAAPAPPLWCLAMLALAVSACSERTQGDGGEAHIIRGKQIYEMHCAACHGAKLEGQANWRERLPTGRLPAPPHDQTGHTWHHPDAVLFGITRNGMAPYAPPGYQSDMPAFGGILSDEDIRAVLAFIRSTWPEEARALQAQVTRDAAERNR